ncbi:uncharacterized protein N7458_000503 [Penicillium daleae]|uniref:Uncharacterized protein n=1 Tax=Penicillium daleae TaxID=63821 RepID=A0AAD6G8X7_9EURO|nr:uncharacterized protein N7458_000503 [Penicillium daleae]KAJ5464817.1 hypothetical protein N7458_000503 [Penicillium daleae]
MRSVSIEKGLVKNVRVQVMDLLPNVVQVLLLQPSLVEVDSTCYLFQTIATLAQVETDEIFWPARAPAV